MRLLSKSYLGGFLAIVAVMSACLIFEGCGGGGGSVATAPPTALPTLSLVRVTGGFSQPVQIVQAGDGSGRLFVVERAGLIRILRNGAIVPTPFLDLRAQVQTSGAEQGLLGLAFPPDYTGRGHFYVNFTDLNGVGDTVLVRYRLTANADEADPASADTLLRQAQPFSNHNGGQLAFGPDGYLYVGMGDGGSGGDPLGNAQNSASLLGKLLRLDVESGAVPYAIPAGNPFGNEIWALGLRNPWRFSFDRASGDLYIGDVGQNAYEEVHFQPAASAGGLNYGWNRMEGRHCYNATNCVQTGLAAPVAEYDHNAGDCSITGGYVYRGTQYPALQGIYIYGDFCSGRIWGLRRNGSTWENQLLLDSALNISTFGEDQAGELYVADYASGDLYRIALP